MLSDRCLAKALPACRGPTPQAAPGRQAGRGAFGCQIGVLFPRSAQSALGRRPASRSGRRAPGLLKVAVRSPIIFPLTLSVGDEVGVMPTFFCA